MVCVEKNIYAAFPLLNIFQKNDLIPYHHLKTWLYSKERIRPRLGYRQFERWFQEAAEYRESETRSSRSKTGHVTDLFTPVGNWVCFVKDWEPCGMYFIIVCQKDRWLGTPIPHGIMNSLALPCWVWLLVETVAANRELSDTFQT